METGSVHHPTASRYFTEQREPAIRNCCATIDGISHSVSTQIQFLGLSGQNLSIALEQLVHKVKEMQEEGESQLEDITRLQQRHFIRIKGQVLDKQTQKEVAKESPPPFGMYL